MFLPGRQGALALFIALCATILMNAPVLAGHPSGRPPHWKNRVSRAVHVAERAAVLARSMNIQCRSIDDAQKTDDEGDVREDDPAASNPVVLGRWGAEAMVSKASGSTSLAVVCFAQSLIQCLASAGIEVGKGARYPSAGRVSAEGSFSEPHVDALSGAITARAESIYGNGSGDRNAGEMGMAKRSSRFVGALVACGAHVSLSNLALAVKRVATSIGRPVADSLVAEAWIAAAHLAAPVAEYASVAAAAAAAVRVPGKLYPYTERSTFDEDVLAELGRPESDLPSRAVELLSLERSDAQGTQWPRDVARTTRRSLIALSATLALRADSHEDKNVLPLPRRVKLAHGLPPQQASQLLRSAWSHIRTSTGTSWDAVGIMMVYINLSPDDYARAMSDAGFWTNLGMHLVALNWGPEAAAAYAEAVAMDNRNLGVWVNMGVALRKFGALDAALGCYEQVMALAPPPPSDGGPASPPAGVAECLYNSAILLEDLGRAQEALDKARGAVRYRRYDFAEAYFTRGRLRNTIDGDTLGALADLEVAEKIVLGFDPEGIAEVLEEQEDVRKMGRDGGDGGESRDLIVAARTYGDRDERTSLEGTQRDLLSRITTVRGTIVARAGGAEAFTAAEDLFRRTIDEDPRYPFSYINLASVYRKASRRDDAVALLGKAISLDPSNSEAYGLLGSIQMDMRDWRAAIGNVTRADTLKGSDASVYFCHLQYAKTVTADWTGLDARLARLRRVIAAQLAARRGDPLYSCVHPFISIVYPLRMEVIASIAAHHAASAEVRARALRSRPYFSSRLSLERRRMLYDRYAIHSRGAPSSSSSSSSSSAGSRKDERARRPRRIRVAMVSSEFRNHPLTYLLKPMLVGMDRARFRVTLYAITPDNHGREHGAGGRIGTGAGKRAELAREAEIFVDASEMSVTEIAEAIRRDRTDVLFNLDGYTSEHERPEIFHLRPAPVQISFMGYASTMADNVTDYIVTDRIATPPRLSQFFSEKFIYMPHSYYLNGYRGYLDPTALAASAPSRASIGLPEDGFVFANFCRNIKFDPHLARAWARILRESPGSVLWILRYPEEAERNLRRALSDLGIPGDRLVTSSKAPVEEHLARSTLADVVLDTALYNGHTTTTDALFAGVPVITRAGGGTMVSRVAASIIASSGLDVDIQEVPRPAAEGSEGDHASGAVAFAHDSMDGYVRAAVALARAGRRGRDLVRARKILANGGDDRLFDSKAWVAALENAVEIAWGRYIAGAPRSHIVYVE